MKFEGKTKIKIVVCGDIFTLFPFGIGFKIGLIPEVARKHEKKEKETNRKVISEVTFRKSPFVSQVWKRASQNNQAELLRNIQYSSQEQSQSIII